MRWFRDVARGRRPLPVWMEVAIVPIALLVVVQTAAQRGWAVGAVAALSYGYLAIPKSVTQRWGARRSNVGNYLVSFLLLTGLSYVALLSLGSRSTAVCAAAALLVGVTTMGTGWVLRGRLAS
jgi:hypothetical protein